MHARVGKPALQRRRHACDIACTTLGTPKAYDRGSTILFQSGPQSSLAKSGVSIRDPKRRGSVYACNELLDGPRGEHTPVHTCPLCKAAVAFLLCRGGAAIVSRGSDPNRGYGAHRQKAELSSFFPSRCWHADAPRVDGHGLIVGRSNEPSRGSAIRF